MVDNDVIWTTQDSEERGSVGGIKATHARDRLWSFTSTKEPSRVMLRLVVLGGGPIFGRMVAVVQKWEAKDECKPRVPSVEAVYTWFCQF